MLSRLSGVLDEAVMGFLALAALSLGLAPLLFELPSGVEQGFDVAEGGWLTVVVTGSVVGLCLLTKRHYVQIRQELARAEALYAAMNMT